MSDSVSGAERSEGNDRSDGPSERASSPQDKSEVARAGEIAQGAMKSEEARNAMRSAPAQEVLATSAESVGATTQPGVTSEIAVDPSAVSAAPQPAATDIPPTLREQMMGQVDSIEQAQAVEDFLASPAGVEAARQYEFAHQLENSNLTDAQKLEAMRRFTNGEAIPVNDAGQLVINDDLQVAELDGVTMTDATPVSGPTDDRSAAKIAADYARGINETVAAIANSRFSWAAGIAFDAVALAAGGPVKFAMGKVLGEGFERVQDMAVDYLTEQLATSGSDLTADDVAHLTITGSTILGAAALGWRGVRDMVRDLPGTVRDIKERAQRFMDDLLPPGDGGLAIAGGPQVLGTNRADLGPDDTRVEMRGDLRGSGLPRLNRNMMTEAERVALDDTLGHLRAGTRPAGPTATRWGVTYENRSGALPDLPQGWSYREYRVADTQGREATRVVAAFDDQERLRDQFYTRSHYGDNEAVTDRDFYRIN